MKHIYKIKSPLRYPGGKTRALKTIIPLVPDFNEYREPFIGGGSVFFSIKQTFPGKVYWINDLNYDLFSFWKNTQENLDNLVKTIKNIKKTSDNGRELYDSLNKKVNKLNQFERAVRFFVLNRITYSGTVDAGGYTKRSYEERFTDSSIERLSKIESIINGVKITNKDYSVLVKKPGKNVFIFLDPPYFSTSYKIYGKVDHLEFDHHRFASIMEKCNHKWLITYDNAEEIKNMFDFAYIQEWSQKYGMSNNIEKNSSKKNELLISNFPLETNNQPKLI